MVYKIRVRRYRYGRGVALYKRERIKIHRVYNNQKNKKNKHL